MQAYFLEVAVPRDQALVDALSDPVQYSVEPELPPGLHLNIVSGDVQGIPLELLEKTNFTFTAGIYHRHLITCIFVTINAR